MKEWDAGNIKTFSLVCLGEGRKYFIYDDSKWKVELEDHNVLAGTHYIYPASRKFANPDLFYETDEDFVKALSKIKYFKEYPLEIEKLHLASKTELGDKIYYFLSDNCQWDNIYESLEYLDYYQANDKAKYRYKSVVEEKYKEFYEKNKVDEIEYDYCLEERKEINIKQYKHFPRYVLIFNVYESKNPDVNIRLFFTTDFISEKHTRFTFDGISFNNQYIRL